MLTRLQALADFDFSSGRIVPDRLTALRHKNYLEHAQALLEIYRQGTGQTRYALHRQARDVFRNEEDCPQRRIDAFCKLLDDASDYYHNPAGKAARLRREVFRAAAALHPLADFHESDREADALWMTRAAATQTIAQAHKRPWLEIERSLYADVPEFHRLETFHGFENGRALLSRYNVAQVQAALFDAVSMTVWATQDYKSILQYARLSRLMHSLVRESTGRYCFHFDGPASMLRSTPRYGRAMARFVAGLVSCRDWKLTAVVRPRRGFRLKFDLSSSDGLSSAAPPKSEFDSGVELRFATEWGSEPRDGWRLIREGEILWRGQKTFVPDFVIEHERGARVLLEIVGFWTPEYLQAKLETLKLFRDVPLLLAVAEKNRETLAGLPHSVIGYKTALSVEDVSSALANVVRRLEACPPAAERLEA
jgi:uncharacterized protein